MFWFVYWCWEDIDIFFKRISQHSLNKNACFPILKKCKSCGSVTSYALNFDLGSFQVQSQAQEWDSRELNLRFLESQIRILQSDLGQSYMFVQCSKMPCGRVFSNYVLEVYMCVLCRCVTISCFYMWCQCLHGWFRCYVWNFSFRSSAYALRPRIIFQKKVFYV